VWAVQRGRLLRGERILPVTMLALADAALTLFADAWRAGGGFARISRRLVRPGSCQNVTVKTSVAISPKV
jgi:hypothetical protein